MALTKEDLNQINKLLLAQEKRLASKFVNKEEMFAQTNKIIDMLDEYMAAKDYPNREEFTQLDYRVENIEDRLNQKYGFTLHDNGKPMNQKIKSH